MGLSKVNTLKKAAKMLKATTILSFVINQSHKRVIRIRFAIQWAKRSFAAQNAVEGWKGSTRGFRLAAFRRDPGQLEGLTTLHRVEK